MSMETKPLPVPSVIAIDGPVASGKTTVGKALAKRLRYRFVDTGVMYRATTWVALQRGIAPDDDQALGILAQQTAIDLVPLENGDSRVLAGGADITDHLFSIEVEQAVSLISQAAAVRRALVASQRRMAESGRIVMVGRDIGTQVLPNAPAKVFLEAPMEERTHRRLLEQQAAGLALSSEEVEQSLQRRDTLDSQRAESPLRPADDALHVQTSGLTIEGVVEYIIALVSTR
jgi:cytidylate kinase